jgi:hypothetical protein
MTDLGVIPVPRSRPTGVASPDAVGFRDAQKRLRTALGVDAVFTIPPGAPVWPPGTELDPESGGPYDPFLTPVSQEEATEITVRASFASRPLAGADPTVSPIGAVDTGSAALILDAADYPPVASAQRVRVGPEIYSIELARHDQIAGYDRMILDIEHA